MSRGRAIATAPTCAHGWEHFDAAKGVCLRCPPPPLRRPDFLALAEAAMGHAPSAEALQRATERDESEQREARLLESGVRGAITDEDFEGLIAGTLLETHAIRSVQRWRNVRSGSATKPMTTLVLVGLTGRGKTLAGGWLLAAIGGKYATAETLRRSVVSTHWRDAAPLEQLIKARCVVIDDAGGELDANSAAAAMFELVNRRSGHSRSWTLITANMPQEEFRERYGERTIRRIEHQGAIIEVSGEDLRRKA